MAPTFSILNNAPRLGFRPAIVLTFLFVAMLFGSEAFSAPAIAKGVFFDPESPAGAEYALPLAQARNEGAGKSGVGKDGSVEPAPLFGEGVSGGPGGGSGRQAAGQQAARAFNGGSSGKGPQGRAPGGAPSHPSGPSAIVKPDSVSDGPGYSALSGIGLVAAIVLVGGCLGLGLRGMQRPRTS